jgi:NAD(P)-dependent dehydrogenase (short-subunit alcohol dehydrogenase family)
MSRLKDKVAIVTGGGSGVGKATAALFLAEGAKVVIAGRDANKLAAVVAELKSGDRLSAIATDVTKADQCRTLIDTATKTFGRVDILVNNAGTNIKARTLRELTPEAWDMMILTNLDGAFYCTTAVLPQMLERHQGQLAIMGSLFGYAGWPGNGSYGASKAAVINLAESLKLELKGTGVDLTLISPGFVDTPLNAAYDPKKKLFVMKKERCARKILEKLPKRPYEIAFPSQVEGFLKTVRNMPRAASFPLVRWFIKVMGA